MYEFIYYRVAHAMTKSPVVVRPQTPLSEIEEIFEQHDFNTVPVVDEQNQLLGVLSKLDFLRAFAFTTESVLPRYEELMRRPAESVMTRQPLTVDPEMPLTRVLEDMVMTRHKSFPVLEAGRVVGMIAREDVLRALRRAAGGERPPE